MADAWFEKNDPCVAFELETMCRLVRSWRTKGERDQSLLELGWSNFL